VGSRLSSSLSGEEGEEDKVVSDAVSEKEVSVSDSVSEKEVSVSDPVSENEVSARRLSLDMERSCMKTGRGSIQAEPSERSFIKMGSGSIQASNGADQLVSRFIISMQKGSSVLEDGC
jgi:hypothetical protein